ncbi:uncharacterized protein LOC114976691 isoform X2 [Acropora millepora]|uniref:uncharacterized protein LOC114976691 isoform X1 n=1 Tax=Acropora millepora TaxID=45264 RepID=UPI001CF19DFC|nr:uncharacterized protein LOC114976691 isoform X1 [Acropora millepora]XP_044169182.1 uncharacterized protein LOC114976691 isoform X2 [Acropora millepora]
MAVVVRSCCCGCSLKTGVLVIAFLSLIGGGYNIHSSFSSASEFSRGSYGGLSPPSAEHLQVAINLQKTAGALSVFQVLTSLSLVAACILRNRLLVLPYLVLNVILLGYNLGVVIYYIVVWKLISLIIFIAISWAFSIYFLIVVYSFHEALREDPSGVTAGFLVNNPTGSAPNANYAV